MHRPDPHATQAHWDALAETYDAAKARNDVYYSTLKACFADAVPASHRERVLEVGCGTGQVLASLNPTSGVGIDSSEKMILAARQQFGSRGELQFESIDATQAAELGPFDAVISGDVMEHVPAWEAVVTAMIKACRPEGIIAISTPNPRWAAPLWVLERVGLKMPEGPHQFVPAARIAGHLRQNGCRVLRSTTHLTLPVRLGGFGPWFSRQVEAVPGLRSLGVIQMVVAVVS